MLRALLLACLSVLGVAHAAPETLLHQGRLLDASGEPLQGAQTLDFALWDAAADGTRVWSGQASVQLENGYYAVVLGSGEMDPIGAELLAQQGLWLVVDPGLGGEPERVPLHAVPYALQAASVSGGVVDASEVRIDGELVIDNQGTFLGPTVSVPEAVLLQGVQGTLARCGLQEASSTACSPSTSIPIVCLRSTAEYDSNADSELFASDFLTPAAWWTGSQWQATARGSGGPCTHGTLNFEPIDPAGGATRSYLHHCGRSDATSVGCRYPEDGWPVVCQRQDSGTEYQRGGFMVVQAHFTGGEWRGVRRGSGGPCTFGVWFWSPE